MYFKQKLAYMALGCLFTIIGYTIASLSGNPVDAQSQADKSEPTVIDDIVCRSLNVVDANGKTFVSIGTIPENELGIPTGGYMNVYGSNDGPTVMISAFSKGGAITVNGRDSLPSVGIGIDSNGGRIAVYGHDLILTPVVEISTNPDGGSMNIRHASGGMAITMGIADTEKEGFVQVQRKGQKGGIQLVANEYGGSMEIFNNGGKNVLQASVGDTGGGIINTRDKHGYRTGQLP